ncbi:tetratricopeptide repeat protein [Polaromonas sp.]|uniref:tetratricopeptide repeat protein n=1 Tax=Polaromonas sp. TaxID=1869339 RepID=UPI0013BC6CCA|nr:tetratricopeptide repeat protein [Polaromonas sp.]NDP63248.1 tetratricopeptide repeat protein [Polaromonas sp.]
MKIKACQSGLSKWLLVMAGVALEALSVSASAELIDSAAGSLASSGLGLSSVVFGSLAACIVKPVYPLPNDPASLAALQAQLDVMEPECLRSAGFYAWRGTILLAQRQNAAAIEALERALLLDPSLPGAQLDYLDALLRIGDNASAKNLMKQLATRTDLPVNVRSLLEREIAATNTDVWRTHWVLTAAAGVDSNLNNAPALNELTLTFPQGPVTLPLLETSRPRNGAVALNTVQWQGLKPQGSQLWLFLAELRARHTASPASRYQQADLSANWLQSPGAPHQWMVRTGLTRIDFGGQKLLQSFRASVLHQWQVSDTSVLPSVCKPGIGIDLEVRHYPVSFELNGGYGGLVGALNCRGVNSLDMQLRLGRDQADTPSRPGGHYRRAELHLNWEARYGYSRLNANYVYTRQIDGNGYSPLLSNNQTRQASRHSFRAEIARPLEPSWLGGAEGFFSIEFNQQASNLAAFNSRQNALYAGLRWVVQ